MRRHDGRPRDRRSSVKRRSPNHARAGVLVMSTSELYPRDVIAQAIEEFDDRSMGATPEECAAVALEALTEAGFEVVPVQQREATVAAFAALTRIGAHGALSDNERHMIEVARGAIVQMPAGLREPVRTAMRAARENKPHE